MRLCTVPHCGIKHEAHGLCMLHYSRMYRLGSVDLPPRKPKIVKPPCTVYECETKSKVKGMCAKHYASFKRYGNPVYSDYWVERERKERV